MRAAAGVLAVALAVGAVAGCSDKTPAPVTVTATAPATGASPGSVSGGAASPSGSTVTDTASPARGYVASLTDRSGSDGDVAYDVQVPTLSGGSTVVTQRFNDSMRASVAGQLRKPTDIPGKMTVKPGRLANDERSRVTHIGPGVVAGLLLTNAYIAGGAHGSTLIGTIVITTKSAQPVMLSDLFTSPSTGLATLAARVKERKTDPAGETVFVQDPARDMANWLPSPAGLTVYGAVTHAAGDWLPITVPWSELKDVISPAMWPVITA